MNTHHIFKKILLSLGLVGILALVTLLGVSQSVKADDNNADYLNALKTTPKGLNWDNHAFVIADFEKAAAQRKAEDQKSGLSTNYRPTSSINHHSSMVNNAEIVKSLNPNSPNTSVIKMTNNNWQTGAVWSNPDQKNFFDMSHEQIASMWLYFGRSDNTSALPGDGMAFVLQNDNNKENAIALSPSGIPVNGQSLGVWGSDWDIENENHPERLAQTAIRNSWALEFDTFVNMERVNITGEGNSFDSAISENINSSWSHIAGNYPAQSDTYQFGVGYPYYYTMKHEHFRQQPNLVDSKWHHVTIKWEPNKDDDNLDILSYAYDDKDPDTGMPLNTTNSYNHVSFELDLKKLGLSGSNKQLYWGFTGSTGRNSENNLMVFESIPSFVDVHSSSKIYDVTQGNKLVNANDTVDPNNDIKYEYSLSYKGWSKGWHDINASIKIPKHVYFNSGTITFPDSQNKEPYQISPSAFHDGSIDFVLPEALDHESRNAIITLNGKTEKIATSTLDVPSTYASFDGDNLITGTVTDPFKIRARNLSLESSSPNPIKTPPHKSVDVPGQVTYVGTNNANPDYSSMVVHQTLNGTTTEIKNAIDQYGKFTLNIDGNLLNEINTLNFYVTDNDGNTSNSISRQIVFGGLLEFGNIQENVHFKPINGSFTNQVIPRLNKWQIDVVDSRDKGSTWTVQATASDLVNETTQQKLDGNLFFRDSAGKNNLLNNPVNVATHMKDIDGTQTKNITDAWTNTDGILLSMQKGNPVGTYQGKISWSLIDSTT